MAVKQQEGPEAGVEPYLISRCPFLLHSSNSHSPSPPSSSNAFSLLSSEQDNPSTSGCRLVRHLKIKTYALQQSLPLFPLLFWGTELPTTAKPRLEPASGCAIYSSQESAKAKTQKEVIKTLKELKLHLPAEKRHNNKSTTLNTLKYALRCVKQVEGKAPCPHLLLSKPTHSHSGL